MATTNLQFDDLEDDIVAKLAANALMTNRVAAAISPLIDIAEYPTPPFVLVSATGDDVDPEKQPIGRPIVRKMTVTVEIVIFGTHYRSRGDAAGIHELAATIKDELQGYFPSTLVQRPFVYESGNVFDYDETTRLIGWVQSWKTMTQVQEA
jgi:hypothetical protein